VVAALLICVFCAVAGVGYVWHRSRNQRLEVEINRANFRLQSLQQRENELDSRLRSMRSPDQVRARVRGMNLVMPRQEQILTLQEPARESAAGAGTARLMARRDGP